MEGNGFPAIFRFDLDGRRGSGDDDPFTETDMEGALE